MNIKKAVVTAAKASQRSLPLQSLVDGDGVERSALELIVAEIVSAGIEEVCVVVQPGDQDAYRHAAGEHGGRLSFVEQTAARGYGDALFRAREFVGDSSFLHLVGDHLYLSRSSDSCAKQLVSLAATEGCAVTAVQRTRENRLPYFGTIGATRLPQSNNLYEVKTVIEKPTPTQAEQELVVAGLRSGYYLCVFGMHVLTPEVMDLLEKELQQQSEPVALSSALNELATRERYLAMELDGTRHNVGVKYGLLYAQLALSLNGRDRDQVLAELVQLLAENSPPS